MPIVDGIITAPETRSTSNSTPSVVGITLSTPGVICPSGYHPLMDAPEVAAAVWRIADMLGSMTIYEMRNTESGDVRIRDELSRKVDIEPWSLSNRSAWVSWIASTMLTQGEAFVLPVTRSGRLEDLVPQPKARAQFRPDGLPYEIVIDGTAFAPNEMLHFPLRPAADHHLRQRRQRPERRGAALQLPQAVLGALGPLAAGRDPRGSDQCDPG